MKTAKLTFHKYLRKGNMTNGLPKYDFLYDNNTFHFNKNTMDPSSRTRAGSLQSLIKVVYGEYKQHIEDVKYAIKHYSLNSGFSQSKVLVEP